MQNKHKKLIKRELGSKILALAENFPIISVLGPRQSGKTTMVKMLFPNYQYVNLEDMDTRAFAIEDPRLFLKRYNSKIIFDEIQRAPELFSYLQTLVDEEDSPGRFILTGSHNYLLREKISQTLAGRVAIVTLLPFSWNEVYEEKAEINNLLFNGFFPKIKSDKISPNDWFPSYIQTYIERDVRLIKNISNLHDFQKFLKLCATRNGQILNLSSLGNECGITHNTAKAWLSVLESSYIIFLLQPYLKNFGKRLVKMPKLYFYDAGLAAHLLGIESPQQLLTHYARGALFESFIISEIAKSCFNKGVIPNVSFWHDHTGNEVDCVFETGGVIKPIEIKSGATITDNFFRGLKYWKKLVPNVNRGYVIYAGEQEQSREWIEIIRWQRIGKIFFNEKWKTKSE